MNAAVEQALMRKLRNLSPEQIAEVQDFVEFLASKSGREAALRRLLAIAPALEQAGASPMTDDEVRSEVRAARAGR